jgi:hypothetical protein
MVDINSNELQSQGQVINIAAGAAVQTVQNAIDNADPGSIIQLAAGTYEFTRQLLITRSDIELRGMGSGETIIQAKFDEGHIDNLISVEGSAGPQYTLLNDAPNGSNVITISDTSRIEVGDVLQVRQFNDDEYLATLGNGTWNQDGWLRDSLARVAQISGNQIIFEHDLEFDFEGGIAIVKKLNMAENVKLGQFTVSYENALGIPDDGKMVNTAPEYAVWGENAAVKLYRTANAELFDIRVENSGSTAFEFTTSLEIKGDQLVADGAHNKAAGNGDALLWGSIHHSEFTNIEDYGMRHGVTAFGHQSSTNNFFHVRFTDSNIDWHGGQDHDNTVIVEESILLRGRDWDSWAVRINVNGSVTAANAPTDPNANTTVFEYLLAGKQAEEVYAVDYGGELIGGANNDTIHGGLGDDTLQGGGQVTLYKPDFDIIDGGPGFDRAVFVGNRADYNIEISGGIVTVTDSVKQRDDADRLENIELLQFADQTLTVPDLKIYVPPATDQQSDAADDPTDTGGTTEPADDADGTTEPADDPDGTTEPADDPEVTASPEPIKIRFGGETAGQFDGIDDFAEVPHSDTLMLDQGTISFAFKANDLDGSQGLLSKDSSGYDTGGHFSIRLKGDQLQFRIQSVDESYLLAAPGGAVSAESWHTVTVNWGGNGAALYLDGILQATNTYTGGLGATSGGEGNFAPLVIGAWSGMADDFASEGISQFFAGEIADAMIFDRALRPEEVESAVLAAESALPKSNSAAAPNEFAGLVIWLDADDGTTISDIDSDNDVDMWTDKSGEGNDASQNAAISQPTIIAAGINGRTAIGFDGIDDRLEVADADTINIGGPYVGKTMMMAFRTGVDVTGRQVLYEQGGQTRGLNIYIDDGELYLNGWNLAETVWSPSFTKTAINANTTYVATLVFDQAAGTVEAFVDGNSIGSVSGVSSLNAHSQDIGIGAANNSTRFHDYAFAGDGHYFDGLIGEYLQYNRALTNDERPAVEDYLQDRWQGVDDANTDEDDVTNIDSVADLVTSEADPEPANGNDTPSETDNGYEVVDGVHVFTNAEKASHVTIHNFDNLSNEVDTATISSHDVINLKGLFENLGGIYADGLNDLEDRSVAIFLQQKDLDADGNVDDVFLTIDGLDDFSIALIDPSKPWPEVFGIGNGDGEFDDIWV